MITSLGRTASPFSSCRAEWCRRALTTSAHAEMSSTPPMPPKVGKKTDSRSGKFSIHNGPPRIFVRPWDGVPSMLDGFAMIRGIEKKYGKVKSFKFIRDGEMPSAYFSYFWVELEDPSRHSDTGATVLQIPVPEVERKRPGGIGIADLQPFLRPSLEAQEETQEWKGVTERMVDEVDESKRKDKVYDLRLESSPAQSRSFQVLDMQKLHYLFKVFAKWGGFGPAPSQGTTGPSTTPTLDNFVTRGSQFIKAERPTPVAENKTPPPPPEEPHKPFNFEFDEPVHSTETQTSASPQAGKVPSTQPQSLLTMQREGKSLSKKQKTLLQAAAISRTPLPNREEQTLAAATQKAKATSERKMETVEEKKQIRDGVWKMLRSSWF